MAFCPGCGTKIEALTRFCTNCGAPASYQKLPSQTAPIPQGKKRSRGLLIAISCLALFFIIIMMIVVGPQEASLSGADSARRLLSACGSPSSDLSTENENPRPLVPIRTIEYQKYNLRFLFTPGDGAKPTDPPPYFWSYVGTTDMSGGNPATDRVVAPSDAVSRMPCTKGKFYK